MKHTLIFILLFISNIAFAQTYKAVYECVFVEKENYIAEEIMAQEQLQDNEFYVVFDSKYSVFYSLNISEERIDFGDAFAGITTYLFWDSANKFYYFQTHPRHGDFCVEKEQTIWQITDETKIIDDYTCIKAIGKTVSGFDAQNNPTYSPIEAWFIPELPYGYGPNYTSGLPGLVAQAIINNRVVFNLKQLHKIESTDISQYKCDLNDHISFFDYLNRN